MSALHNGQSFFGVRNATTMRCAGIKPQGFDPNAFREVVERAKRAGLIVQTFEPCLKCSQPAVQGKKLCAEHRRNLTGYRKRKEILSKECPTCKKEYQTIWQHQFYCSSHCKTRMKLDTERAKKKRKVRTATCAQKGCKNIFERKSMNHRFCPTCGPMRR